MYTITAATLIVTVFLVIIGKSDAEHCCGKFEEEANCSNTCQEKKCNPTGEQNICSSYCKDGCVCKEGFVRISDNMDQCIPKCLCSFLAPFIEDQTSCYPCSKYSRYTTCGGSCPETCNPSEYAAVLCSADQNLVGCVCNPGFVKVSIDIDICIPKRLCRFVLPYISQGSFSYE